MYYAPCILESACWCLHAISAVRRLPEQNCSDKQYDAAILLAKNPQIKDPDKIAVGQKINR